MNLIKSGCLIIEMDAESAPTSVTKIVFFSDSYVYFLLKASLSMILPLNKSGNVYICICYVLIINLTQKKT